MKIYIKVVLSAVGILLLSIPLAAAITILLAPFWTWIETTYGIESIGHSGPADWCFEAVFMIVGAGLGLATWFGFWSKRI